MASNLKLPNIVFAMKTFQDSKTKILDGCHYYFQLLFHIL